MLEYVLEGDILYIELYIF